MEVKFLEVLSTYRKSKEYREMADYLIYEYKDWRILLESFFKKIRKDEHTFGEAHFWVALLTDKKYNISNRMVLLEDWLEYVKENGNAYFSLRAKESSELLKSYLKKKKENSSKKINRDDYLLNLFQKNEAIYDKFFERCKGHKDIEVVDILLAILEILYGEKEWRAKLKSNKLYLKNIHSKLCTEQLLRNAYSTFYRDLDVNNKANTLKRRTEINNAKAEFQKILS